MMTSRVSRWLKAALFCVLLCGAGAAQAHPGHALHGFFDGFVHPWSGWDHLLAMIAVGIWAVQMGSKRFLLWLLPAAFVASVAVGAIHGYFGGTLPVVEPAILASLLVLGVLLAVSIHLPAAMAVLLMALFGIFHGQAHGAEIPQTAAAWMYGCGFVMATVCLHALGMSGAQAAMKWKQAWLLRLTGAGIAASGLALMMA